MIVMFIFGTKEKEIQCVYQHSRSLAGRWSEEYWEILSLHTEKELLGVMEEKEHADMICMDITTPGSLDITAKLREQNPSAYLILIADSTLSPITYMRPSIGAESLMLKPLSEHMVQEVMSEAIQAFLKRFYKPDEGQMYVIENKDGRTVIPYDAIHFFEARDKRIYLNTATREYGFYETMDQLEEQLSEQFIRCHRGFLVNKSKITNIFLSRNCVMLDGEIEVPVSRSYKAVLKEYGKGGAAGGV